MSSTGRRTGWLAMSGGAVLLAYALGGKTVGNAAAMGVLCGGGLVCLMFLPYAILERSRAKQARDRGLVSFKPPMIP